VSGWILGTLIYRFNKLKKRPLEVLAVLDALKTSRDDPDLPAVKRYMEVIPKSAALRQWYPADS
jgi:hypothetical protein